jgi:glucose-6-phosphate-specific signal transduction histidine kinase
VAQSDELGLSAEQERIVYRVAQECLRNAAKHAGPCTVTVSVLRKGDAVALDVSTTVAASTPARSRARRRPRTSGCR